MKRIENTTLWSAAMGCTIAAALLLLATPAGAQNACPADFCENPVDTLCDAGGFRITLADFQPAAPSNSGFASYTYEICSPPEGTCSLDPTRSCLDNDKCAEFNAGTCERECAVDSFRDLSHFDIGLPAPVGTCLSESTQITGSCSAGDFFSVETGDKSCDPDLNAAIAKCDAGLSVGECYQMTINIAGELTAPGLGSAFVVSKESRDCNETCILGPSCEPCDGGPDPDPQCLTRTRGFWGTHPHLIRSDDPRSLDLLPITVCGDDLTTVDAGVCSTSEALCTSARDLKKNPTYLAMAAQLTAAKLNLAATAAVSDGTCSAWMYDSMGIEDWISYCEDNYCDARKQAISESGCIEALTDFNESQDTGFDQTPAPFDRPGPALVDECRSARGNGLWVGGGC